MLQTLQLLVLVERDGVLAVGLHTEAVLEVGDDFLQPGVGGYAPVAAQHADGGAQGLYLLGAQLVAEKAEVGVFVAVVALAAFQRVGLDGGVETHTLAQASDVFSYLAHAHFGALQVGQGLVHLLHQVVDGVLVLSVAEAAVEYAVAELGVFVRGHGRDIKAFDGY